jgi:hypothetical protein
MQWRQKYFSCFVYVLFISILMRALNYFLSCTYIGKALDGVLSALNIHVGPLLLVLERAWWFFLCAFLGYAVIFFITEWDGWVGGLPVDHTRDCGIEQMMVLQIEYRVHSIIITSGPFAKTMKTCDYCLFKIKTCRNRSRMESRRDNSP